jgi:hypothetical protein
MTNILALFKTTPLKRYFIDLLGVFKNQLKD